MSANYKDLVLVAKEMKAHGVEVKTVGVKGDYLEGVVRKEFKKVKKSDYSAQALEVLGTMGLIKPAKAAKAAPDASEQEAPPPPTVVTGEDAEAGETTGGDGETTGKDGEKHVKASVAKAVKASLAKSKEQAEAPDAPAHLVDKSGKGRKSKAAVAAYFAERKARKEVAAAAPEPDAPVEVSDEDLRSVAAAMNRVMDLDPQLATDESYGNLLDAMRKEAYAKDGLRDEDFGGKDGFTKEEAGILGALFGDHKVFRAVGTPPGAGAKAGKAVKAAGAKAGKAVKAAGAKKAPRAPKGEVKLGPLGSREGSYRNAMDVAIMLGGTAEHMAAEGAKLDAQVKADQVVSHMMWRKKRGDVKVVETKGKDGAVSYTVKAVNKG